MRNKTIRIISIRFQNWLQQLDDPLAQWIKNRIPDLPDQALPEK